LRTRKKEGVETASTVTTQPKALAFSVKGSAKKAKSDKNHHCIICAKKKKKEA
jgi:hypothetical protein